MTKFYCNDLLKIFLNKLTIVPLKYYYTEMKSSKNYLHYE